MISLNIFINFMTPRNFVFESFWSKTEKTKFLKNIEINIGKHNSLSFPFLRKSHFPASLYFILSSYYGHKFAINLFQNKNLKILLKNFCKIFFDFLALVRNFVLLLEKFFDPEILISLNFFGHRWHRWLRVIIPLNYY